MHEMSEDELAKACAEALYARDVAAQYLGIDVVEAGPGRSVLRMIVRPEMLNGHGICHGGFTFALADTAFAYACNSRNVVNLAQGCSIDYSSPGREGEVLTAVAEQRTRTGRTGLYDVTVTRPGGEVVAHFRGRAYRIGGEILAP